MKFLTDSKNEELIEKFIGWICNELQIQPKSIEVCTDAHFDENVTGYLFENDNTSFTVFANENRKNITDFFITIAHEMIHVKQYMKQGLGFFLVKEQHVPYKDRWWEIEAFKNAPLYVEKFVKENF